jgi:hypothetical protein
MIDFVQEHNSRAEGLPTSGDSLCADGSSARRLAEELHVDHDEVSRAAGLLERPEDIQEPGGADDATRQDLAGRGAAVRPTGGGLAGRVRAVRAGSVGGAAGAEGRGAEAGPPRPRVFRTPGATVVVALDRPGDARAIRAALADALGLLGDAGKGRGETARASASAGESRPMNEIPIAARKIKLSVPLKPDGLPGVPMDGPIGDLTIKLSLEGSGFAVPARINGKSYRRMMKAVAEKGAENVVIVLQGDLVAPPGGGPVRLDAAGFQVIVKTPPTTATPAATAGD